MSNILKFFPLEEARPNQKAVLAAIEDALSKGIRFILVEAPVGSGKSAMAVALARYFKDAHVITPRRSLQNQYFEDFNEHLVLMKGRAAYPCIRELPVPKAKKIIALALKGMVPEPKVDDVDCAISPCTNRQAIYKDCIDAGNGCAYTTAAVTASQSPIVVHNLHSFMFQTGFSDRFSPREVLIIDEAHEIEGVLRDFITLEMTLGRTLEAEVPVPTGMDARDLNKWCDFFEAYPPRESKGEQLAKKDDPTYMTNKDKYLSKVFQLRSSSEYLKDRFSISSNIGTVSAAIPPTFKLIPHKLGKAPADLLFAFGKAVILMSGTMYDTCRILGIPKEQSLSIRIPSTFPVKNRPIFMKTKLMVDTSFANWRENFDKMVESISTIMNVYSDVKGLIHAPSYDAMQEIVDKLGSDRIISHNPGNFHEKLSEFFNSTGNKVFISPVCQQGVDFKGDRARFQIILRVPYPSIGDTYVKDRSSYDFQWYTTQALTVFGQMTGRINRFEADWGHTFLLDSRFIKFLESNKSKLPKWLMDSVIKE